MVFVLKIWSSAGVVCQDWSILRRDAVHVDSYDVYVSTETAFFPSFVIVQTAGTCKNIFLIQFYGTIISVINYITSIHTWTAVPNAKS